ncbi:MAG: hypothetical protein JW967_01340 [Dehalococcoidales bacterium]|nr:hypothetical protein [Dehalococcoidales bacterium]
MAETNGQNQQPEFKPSPEYLARQKRIEDAFNLRRPDRIPVVPTVLHYFPTNIKGISNKDAGYNLPLAMEALIDAVKNYNWDGMPGYGAVRPSKPLEILGIKQFKWPGDGLPDNRPFQFVEGEYMLQSEYDEMLANPNGFTINKLWPRISTTLGQVSAMTQVAPPTLLFMSNGFTLPDFLGGMLAPMTDVLRKALELAEEIGKSQAFQAKYHLDVMNMGYPVLYTANSFSAFDWINDALRGLRGTSLDIFQVPEKLLAAIDMFIPLTIGTAIYMTQLSGIKRVNIYLHRGSAGFMSKEQYEKFYWPSLKALILGLIGADIFPMVYTEGDYTPRLEYFTELPPKKFVLHYDRVDRKKAKKVLGDICCFWGNVPASLLCLGTPQQVTDDVRELIDIFGDNGGLIVDGPLGIPDEARPESVAAMTEAVFKYGV